MPNEKGTPTPPSPAGDDTVKLPSEVRDAFKTVITYLDRHGAPAMNAIITMEFGDKVLCKMEIRDRTIHTYSGATH